MPAQLKTTLKDCKPPDILASTQEVKMLMHSIGRCRKRWVTAAASFALAALVAGGALAGDSSRRASDWKQQLREQEKKQFLREHSDASGKPRPDLWREGIKEQKRMQVAPYIGWHPTTTGQGKSSSADERQ